MIKKLAWNAFKKTGNIDTYLEFMQVKDIEEKMLGDKDGDNKDQGDNNFRE